MRNTTVRKIFNNSTSADVLKVSADGTNAEITGYGTIKRGTSIGQVIRTYGTKGENAKCSISILDLKIDRSLILSISLDLNSLPLSSMANSGTLEEKSTVKFLINGRPGLTAAELVKELTDKLDKSVYRDILSFSTSTADTLDITVSYKILGEEVNIPAEIVSVKIEEIPISKSYLDIPEKILITESNDSTPGKWHYGSFWHIVNTVTGPNILNEIKDPVNDQKEGPMPLNVYQNISFDVKLSDDSTNGLFGQENKRVIHFDFWVKSNASEIATAIAGVLGTTVKVNEV